MHSLIILGAKAFFLFFDSPLPFISYFQSCYNLPLVNPLQSKKIGILSGEWQIASNIFKGSLGNMIEWFDRYVYASFSIYFSAAF
ncbi:MAG: hypothetical protein ACLRN0_07600, partial [Lactobacillus delbrueckii]